MKTFRQLIDELPEPVRSKALANTAPHELDDTSFGQKCPGFLVFAFDWFGAPEGWQYWRDACDGKFEQPAAPAPKNNLQELFNRLPEPWRSKAVSNCEAWYECPLEEVSTTLRDDPGFAFLEGAFPWAPTPEGDEVWRNIRVKGEFPEPEEDDTPRISDLECRVAALEDRLAEPATAVPDKDEAVDPGEGYRLVEIGELIETGDEWLEDGTWKTTCFRTGDGCKLHIEAPLRRKLPPVVVNPGEGYRLLEEGETVLEGDEEADKETGGGWSKIRCAGDTFCKINWFPVRRKLDAEGPSALGDGYRLLERGETILEGDEWWEPSFNRWNPARCFPSTLRINGRVRRKLAPEPAPQAYRLLNPGEIIREGDEGVIELGSLGEDDTWEPTASAGKPYNPHHNVPIRRPLKTYEDA